MTIANVLLGYHKSPPQSFNINGTISPNGANGIGDTDIATFIAPSSGTLSAVWTRSAIRDTGINFTSGISIFNLTTNQVVSLNPELANANTNIAVSTGDNIKIESSVLPNYSSPAPAPGEVLLDGNLQLQLNTITENLFAQFIYGGA